MISREIYILKHLSQVNHIQLQVKGTLKSFVIILNMRYDLIEVKIKNNSEKYCWDFEEVYQNWKQLVNQKPAILTFMTASYSTRILFLGAHKSFIHMQNTTNVFLAMDLDFHFKSTLIITLAQCMQSPALLNLFR